MLLFMLPRYCWGVTQKSAQNLSLFSGGFIIELKNLAFSACCYSQVYLVPPPLCHWIFNISSLENIRSLSRVWVSALIQLCQRWARLRCLRATFCPWKICSSYCPHRTTREKTKKKHFPKTWGTSLVNYPFVMFLHFSWNNDPGSFSFKLCLPVQVATYFVVQISRAVGILQCVISVGLSVMSCIIQPPISVVGNNIFI